MNLPLNYILQSIYQNCKRVVRKNSNIYNFECAVCREGRSSGKKRRGYFFVKEGYFQCQNCQRSWSSVDWIMNTSHLTFRELIKEASEYDNTFNEIINKNETPAVKPPTPSLPHDSINMSDPVQLKYHKDKPEVQMCLEYINARRLNTAINKPNTFYLSLTDYIHKNRLCIPFYDENGKIIYYQTRALYPKDEEIAKYLSKKDADKSLYGINGIDPSLEHLFIFEGPIDSMFCKNGVAACGLCLTAKQEAQLNQYRFLTKIWVLDNQLDNPDVYDKYSELIDKEENVFFWPQEFANYKDLNAVCVAIGKNSIPHKFILNNTFKGMKAQLKLSSLAVPL